MEITAEEIYETAMRQSAIDLGCGRRDFLRDENVIVPLRSSPEARKDRTFVCCLTSYGSNLVASVSEPCREPVADYIRRFPVAHCFETPNLYILDDALREKGMRVCFMAEYFLPEPGRLKALDCPYPMRLMAPDDFAPLYTGAWGNALSEKRKELDVLGVGAYNGGELVGLAACSADCESMWQIGVDVLPGFRRQGIASALTSCLALAILQKGKVPFYCAAWSNLGSVRNAIRSGFRPAWIELQANTAAFVDGLNGAGG